MYILQSFLLLESRAREAKINPAMPTSTQSPSPVSHRAETEPSRHGSSVERIENVKQGWMQHCLRFCGGTIEY